MTYQNEKTPKSANRLALKKTVVKRLMREQTRGDFPECPCVHMWSTQATGYGQFQARGTPTSKLQDQGGPLVKGRVRR